MLFHHAPDVKCASNGITASDRERENERERASEREGDWHWRLVQKFTMPMHSLSGPTSAPISRPLFTAAALQRSNRVGRTEDLSVAPLRPRRSCRAESSRQFSLGQSPRSWHSVATQRPPVEVARLHLAALDRVAKKQKTEFANQQPKEPFPKPSSGLWAAKVQRQSSREPPAKQSQVLSVPSRT